MKRQFALVLLILCNLGFSVALSDVKVYSTQFCWDVNKDVLKAYSQYRKNHPETNVSDENVFFCSQFYDYDRKECEIVNQINKLSTEALDFYKNCAVRFYDLNAKTPSQCQEIDKCKNCYNDPTCQAVAKLNSLHQEDFDLFWENIEKTCTDDKCSKNLLSYELYGCQVLESRKCTTEWFLKNSPDDICFLASKCSYEAIKSAYTVSELDKIADNSNTNPIAAFSNIANFSGLILVIWLL